MRSTSTSRVLALLGAARVDAPHDGPQFVPAEPDELAQFGNLVYEPREPTRRVTSLGVLWHGRRVGRFEGEWALCLEHVVLEPQLPALRSQLAALASIDGLEGWSVLAVRPQTRDGHGQLILAIPEVSIAGYDTASLLLYGALRHDPMRGRGAVVASSARRT